ncbi:MAG TPA: PQQ-binding-like beta-propeller repeat protein [Bryobacteraceae bacterium]|jgi:polyvinyl alcohol dehydrogenase (cytochrome)
MRRLIVSLCFAAAAAMGADETGHCTGTAKAFAPGSGDWNGWGAETSNARYQAHPGLPAADVPRLKLKWAFGFPGDMRAVGQPAVVGGRVFVGSYSGKVYSLDASTGCIYWIYEAGAIVRTGIDVARGAGSQWVAYFGDSKGFAHAVDAQTGKGLWKTLMDEHPLARITGTPAFYDGRLYVPVASGEELATAQTPKYQCCTFRGSLSAVDAATGKVAWKTYTVSDPPKQYKTNAEGTPMFGPAGGGVWSAPTIDVKRKRIYVGTGNSYTGIEISTSDAILGFDLDSGELLWSSQVTPHDNWVPGCPKGVNCPENPGDDYDFGSSPILRTVGGKEMLLAGQKSGLVYGLDPDKRGAVIWKTRVGQGTGLMGGVAWGMAAEDQTVYAAVADINRPDGTPGLYSLRIDTGAKLWGTPAPQGAGNPAQAAAVSAMPGIAFSESFGGRLRAYATKTGQIVWDFDAERDFDTVNKVPAKGGSFNGAGPAISRGMLIATCGYGFAGGQAGNVLLAFSPDGK